MSTTNGKSTFNLGLILKGKWYQICAVLLCASALAASLGYAAEHNVFFNANVNVELTRDQVTKALRIELNSSVSLLEKSCNYLVGVCGSTYYMFRGNDSYLQFWGTNKTAVEAAAIGNVTYGTILLKGITLNLSLTYGSGILIQEDYQGKTTFFSNNAMIYSASAGSFNCTTVYAGVLNASTGYVQAYRLLVENGTSFPSSVSSGYLFFRTDYNQLTFYNGTEWTNCSSGADDDSAYLLSASATNFLFQNGTRALTADWNAGAYGIYGCTWLNSTNINSNGYYLNGSSLGFVEPATFIVDVSGSTYRAWYGSNSTLFTSSTNASAVINNAIGNTTSGTVFFKAGTYLLSTTITPNSLTTLDGEEGAILKLNAQVNVSGITLDWKYGVTIRNLQLDGNKNNQGSGTLNGVYITGTGSYDNIVENCYIHDWNYSGIAIVSGAYKNEVKGCRIEGVGTNYLDGHGISVDGAIDNDIHDNRVLTNPAKNGIEVVASSYRNHVHDNFFDDGGARSQMAILVYDGSYYNTIDNNHVHSTYVWVSGQYYFGIEVYTNSCANTVSGNMVTFDSAGDAVTGIQIDTNANNNTVSLNTAICVGTRSAYYGIMIYNSCNQTLVMMNTVTNWGQALKVNGANCGSNFIAYNNFAGNTYSGIDDSGTSTTFVAGIT